MKRLIMILLICALLSGCAFPAQNVKDPVEFYYLRSCSTNDDYKTYFSEGAIVSESREASGHRGDLYYLLSMYLQGPLSSQVESPFPPGTSVTKVWQEGDHLYVNLNAAAANAEDLKLTLVWSCLAKTCMALSDATTVHIEARSISGKLLFQITVTADLFIWEEPFLPATDTVEPTQ